MGTEGRPHNPAPTPRGLRIGKFLYTNSSTLGVGEGFEPHPAPHQIRQRVGEQQI